jgi:hypothetical protein
MHIGEYNPDLQKLMAAYESRHAAFISAYNPYRELFDESENIQRHTDFSNAVKALGFDTVLGEGRDKEGQWPGEVSLLIFNIP